MLCIQTKCVCCQKMVVILTYTRLRKIVTATIICNCRFSIEHRFADQDSMLDVDAHARTLNSSSKLYQIPLHILFKIDSSIPGCFVPRPINISKFTCNKTQRSSELKLKVILTDGHDIIPPTMQFACLQV